ncbi:MAG: DUF4861 family protein [Bacteroidales bacterium]|nr:DUF4861 family protein [Bacteroidales bacterium]MDT3360922.1 DUF4861 domain-containing protein [Bacteroidota bacterium]
MKRFLILAATAALALTACTGQKEQKVMARAVPERADDFVFENDLIAGRFYGQALEGNPTSPGIDIWVKLPGGLVADEWYSHAVNEDPDYYHHNHGGKDCYKVAVSLGGGASAPFIDGKLCYPATNYRTCEVLETSPDKVSFVLHYPQWQATDSILVSLDKQVSLSAGSYFADVTDVYTFTGIDSLQVAAGMKLHTAQQTVQEQMAGSDRYAIWEKASDQSIEPEDGMLGVAVIVPDAEIVKSVEELDHALLVKTVTSGQAFKYKYGSCWSKGNIHSWKDWLGLVNEQ